MNVKMPYGDKLLEFSPCQDSVEILESGVNLLRSRDNEVDTVLRAMAAPIGSPRLYELAKGKDSATIIISDHTRPVPSKNIIPFMLKELRNGNPDIKITLLVATGCHRSTTRQELTCKLGSEIIQNEKILIHNCNDGSSCADIGALPHMH